MTEAEIDDLCRSLLEHKRCMSVNKLFDLNHKVTNVEFLHRHGDGERREDKEHWHVVPCEAQAVEQAFRHLSEATRRLNKYEFEYYGTVTIEAETEREARQRVAVARRAPPGFALICTELGTGSEGAEKGSR